MSDDKTNKGKSGRKPLGLKRAVEAGEVKQTFSHGRTNKVVVEVKRRKLVGKPGAAPAKKEDKPVVETKKTVKKTVVKKAAPAPAKAKPKTPILSKKELQEKLLRQAEEDRLMALEEARRREKADEERKAEEAKRKAAEAEERKKAEAAEKKKAAAEKKSKKDSEEKPEAKAEAEAEENSETVTEEAAELEKPAKATKAKKKDAGLTSSMPPPRKFTPVAQPPRPEPKAKQEREETNRKESKKPRNLKSDNRRQSGKLTVNRALSGDDGGKRARSLAALKRAREKEKRSQMQGQQREAQPKQVRDVVVPEAITVQELANRMAEKGADLVKSLFNMGSMVTVNQTIDQDTAELLVEEFGHRIKRVSEADVDIDTNNDVDPEESLKPRPPVVTIMGHVDHGKTSLLDALRGTDIAAGEAGGITQHIGAYQVTLKSGEKITFLDTPGHAAFTEMRARGANVTDIVILVVAADDGLMPQTIEAINHSKAANVPLIVAINKVDKDGANPQKIRERLLEHEVIVEAMSGDVQDVEVSALKGINLDELTEKIALQAELLELKANPDRYAEGVVVEAQLDKGRGTVATILVERGTLNRGDVFVVGEHSGKVRAMINDKGKRIKKAGPSVPVEVLGLSGVPSAGDKLTVVENESRAREVAEYRKQKALEKRTALAPATLDTMFSAVASNRAIEYPVLVKGDVQGSVEAIVGSLHKISTDEIKARVLHSGVGGITETDVNLAKASNAPIIGFNVRANAKAREIAEREGVRFKYFDIIYDLIEDIKLEMAGELGPERVETVVGRAEVKEVFPAGKKGKAAGLLVTDGYLKKDLHARIMRDDVIVYNGKVDSLRRFKDDVAEVRAGLECGVVFENTTDLKAGDYVETFEVEERERTL